MYRFKSAKMQDISLPVRIANPRMKRLSCQSRKSHFFSLLLGSRFSPRSNFSNCLHVPGIWCGTRAHRSGDERTSAVQRSGSRAVETATRRRGLWLATISCHHNRRAAAAELPRVPPPLTRHQNTTHFSSESRSCPR